jgi:hypothetical protein
VRVWAGLGALTDAGDLAAALAGVLRRQPYSTRIGSGGGDWLGR